MHPTMRITSTVLTTLALAGCQTGPQPDPDARLASATGTEGAQQDSPAPFPEGRTATLMVKGLACPYCVHNIEKQLEALPGIERVHVDLPTGRVRAALDTDHPATRQQLVDAIEDSGFTLDGIEMPR